MVLVLLLALASFHGFAFASEPRIAVSKSPLSLPFFVAKEKNLFARHKVEPVFVECVGGNRCMAELTEGRVDMATSTELPFMFAAFQNKPVSLIATFVQNKDDMKFLVRKSAINGRMASLANKRVGFIRKASSHYYMDLVLLYYGVDPQAVVSVPMGADQLVGALAKGEVDAISVWEPWGFVALDLLGDDIEVIPTPKLYSQTFNLIVSSDYRSMMWRKTTAVLRALDDAIQFIKKNPDEAKRILGRDAGMDEKMINAALPTYQFGLSLQQSFLTTIQGQARWAKNEKHVDPQLPEPEFLNYIDASFLRSLKPRSVDFIYP